MGRAATVAAVRVEREREVASVRRARAGGLVERVVRRRLGVYEVPSQTATGVVYVVRGTGPLLDGYACSCPAAEYGHVCAHVAAVHLARLRANALREWRRLNQRRTAA